MSDSTAELDSLLAEATDSVAAAERAKANAVSVRSATPTGTVTNNGKRGIRDLLSENLEAVGGGRV